jgi:hypothetical protein
MPDTVYGLLRIHLLRTRVNKIYRLEDWDAPRPLSNNKDASNSGAANANVPTIILVVDGGPDPSPLEGSDAGASLYFG